MKNKIVGIAIVVCTFMILFTGSAAALGTNLMTSVPEYINLLTTSADGSEITTESMIKDVAYSLNPVVAVADVIASCIDENHVCSTWIGKIPKFIRLSNSWLSEHEGYNIVMIHGGSWEGIYTRNYYYGDHGNFLTQTLFTSTVFYTEQDYLEMYVDDRLEGNTYVYAIVDNDEWILLSYDYLNPTRIPIIFDVTNIQIYTRGYR